MAIDEGFIKSLMKEKKQKTYQKYQVAKKDLVEIQKDELRLRELKDSDNKIQKEWEKLKKKEEILKAKVKKLGGLLDRVNKIWGDTSLPTRAEITGLLFGIPKPMVYLSLICINLLTVLGILIAIIVILSLIISQIKESNIVESSQTSTQLTTTHTVPTTTLPVVTTSSSTISSITTSTTSTQRQTTTTRYRPLTTTKASTLTDITMCETDIDCGRTRVELECRDNEAHKVTLTNTCISPGTLASVCETTSRDDLIDVCEASEQCYVRGDVIRCQKRSTKNNLNRNLCLDSDTGLDTDIKGYVEYGGDRYWDMCDGNAIKEQFCDHNLPKSLRIICSRGCEDGKCITLVSPSSITST